MKVLRYGHLRSAPVVVDAAYTHGVGNRLHSVQRCRTPRPLPGRLLDGFEPLQRRANASADRGSAGHRDAFSVAASEKKARSRSS